MSNKLDIQENKEIIKKEINQFCNKISSSKYSGYVNVPVIITVYLGKETYDRVNASFKDAFTTSFSIQPNLYEMLIEAATTKAEIVDNIKNAIIEVSSQGKSYDDIRIAFITMMDDLFYKQDQLGIIDELVEAFKELEYLDLDLSKKSFYGLFDQNKMKENYKNVFEFVNKGKDLWRNIFHIEIPFVDRVITKQTQLIALNLIRDDYTMIQDSNTDYRWMSLHLHYLKISEFITCRLLREIYGKQIDAKNINSETWNTNVNVILDNLFDAMLRIDDVNSYQYVPLKYQEPIIHKSKKSFSLFNRNHQEVIPIYNNVLKDENIIKNLVSQLYDSISINTESYSSIIEQIISASTSIDPNSTNIGDQIISILVNKIENIEQQLVQLNEKGISASNIKDVDSYLNDEFIFYQKIKVLNKEKEIIKQIIENISNDIILKQITNEIVTKNRIYANILDELTLTEYGGTLESLHIQNLPVFKVNQSVAEILMSIDKGFVIDIINNNQSLTKRLQLFLNHTIQNEVPHKHNLGMINKNFTHIQPIISYLLLTSDANNNQDLNDLTRNHEKLIKNFNDMYRDNAFFVISTRNYDSDQYIVNYKR